jgi:type VI secretion system protein ImpH
MADDARRPSPDLSAKPEEMDANALLRALERGGRRFGAPGRPDAEPARLGQEPRLAFAARDVAGFRPANGRAPAKATLRSVGLLGPEGPMPLHIIRWTLDRLSQRWHAAGPGEAVADTTFADFVDMLQHRLIAFHHRAWADCRPEVQAERPGGGRVGALVAALAGLGLPAAAPPDAQALRRHAAAIGWQVEGPERLTRVLADLLGAPATLREFAPEWLAAPAEAQTRLGRRHAALGAGAALGPRSFQRQTRVELRLGPLRRDAFEALLPGGQRLEAVRRTARRLLGAGLRADLRLLLAAPDVPPARLGEARLGRLAWLAPPPGRAAGDVRVADFLQPPARAA